MLLFFHYLSLPYLIEGIEFTLAVTTLGLFGGLVLGIVLAAMQLARFAVLAAFARGYAVIFRGTPLILQMVFAYNALPHIGITLSAIGAAGLALAANEAPFIAEMLRAGVLGVDRGQISAGQALGMTPGLLMRRIIAPQAIRSMIPAFGNETVSALKNSSLASVISVQELTLRSTQLASSTFDFFSIFFASGLIYLVLTAAVSVIQLLVERALDLDRPATQNRFSRLMPWYRSPSLLGPGGADAPAAADTGADPVMRAALVKDGKASRADRTRRSATLDAQRCPGRRQRSLQGLSQPAGAGRRRSDGAGRRGDRPARAKRRGQKHAAALYQSSGGLGRRHRQDRRAPHRLSRRRQGAVAARHRPTNAPASASAWCSSSSTCSAT